PGVARVVGFEAERRCDPPKLVAGVFALRVASALHSNLGAVAGGDLQDRVHLADEFARLLEQRPAEAAGQLLAASDAITAADQLALTVGCEWRHPFSILQLRVKQVLQAHLFVLLSCSVEGALQSLVEAGEV